MNVSVIIPTRNRYDYLELLLNDLNKQSVSVFEILVIDQSDEKKKISGCIQICTDTIGPCVSRNLGVAKSRGDILVFLDDDARINNNFIKEITFPIVNRQFGAVAGAICDAQGNYLLNKNQYFTQNDINFIKVLTKNPNSSESRISICLPGGCSAILKSVFIEIGGFDEGFDPTGAGEDRDLSLRLYIKGFPVWYNAEAKLLHAQAPLGGSRDVGSRSLMLDVHTYKMCKKYFSKDLADTLKKNIIELYRNKFISSIFKMKYTRSKYLLYKELKRLMK